MSNNFNFDVVSNAEIRRFNKNKTRMLRGIDIDKHINNAMNGYNSPNNTNDDAFSEANDSPLYKPIVCMYFDINICVFFYYVFGNK